MKIVDYRKNEDRIMQLRGIEIYPFLKPEQLPLMHGYVHVYLDSDELPDSNRVIHTVLITVNSQLKDLRPVSINRFIAALATANALAMDWQIEIDEELANVTTSTR